MFKPKSQIFIINLALIVFSCTKIADSEEDTQVKTTSADIIPLQNISSQAFPSNQTTLLHSQEEDEFKLWHTQKWLYKKELKGYLVVSDDLKFRTKLFKKKKFIKVSIPVGSARQVEIKKHRRYVDIKISTWNKVKRVRVRVPFGFTPDELKVVEKPKNIQVVAPYDFIEFKEGEQQKKSDIEQ